jgi:uncharacterized membrane protein YedE/YeeE
MSFSDAPRAKRWLVPVAGLAGFIFGLGLLLSGMNNPVRVLAFLDITGAWNPSLAFVMAGAIAVATPAFALARRRGIPLPNRLNIDRRLIAGAVLFGLGWGLTGICPGPAILLATTLRPPALLFGAGLLLGMVGANFWGVKKARPGALPLDPVGA